MKQKYSKLDVVKDSIENIWEERLQKYPMLCKEGGTLGTAATIQPYILLLWDVALDHAVPLLADCKFQEISLCDRDKLLAKIDKFVSQGVLQYMRPIETGCFLQILVFPKPKLGDPD